MLLRLPRQRRIAVIVAINKGTTSATKACQKRLAPKANLGNGWDKSAISMVVKRFLRPKQISHDTLAARLDELKTSIDRLESRIDGEMQALHRMTRGPVFEASRFTLVPDLPVARALP